MKYCIVSACLIVTLAVYATSQGPEKWAFHRDFLKKNFDLSDARRFRSDSTWRIRCIFADIDGDGSDELLSASISEEEDRMGHVWIVWDIGKDGALTEIPRKKGSIWYLSGQDAFHRIVYRDRTSLVVGLGLYAGHMDAAYRRIVKATPDCAFSVANEGYCLHEIKPNIDSVFRGREVVALERLPTEWYFGFDFRPPQDTPYNSQTHHLPYNPPKGDLRPGGGVVAPPGFAAFVARYRDEVRRRRGTPTGKLSVYAVFLDADNDGAADCYVTSDAARVSEGVYDWELYLDWEGTLEKADEEIHPDEGKPELCVLKPSVRAGKRAFCRVLRYDALPTFVVLDAESSAKTKVRDAITPYSAHRIEKLDCIEFPETSISK